MAPVTFWDMITIINHEDENAIIPPDSHLVLYTIAQEGPIFNIVRGAHIPTPLHPPPPPPIFAATRFRLPLPKTNDPDFRREVLVDGKPGLQLSKCCQVGERVYQAGLQHIISQMVEKPMDGMDHLCHGQYFWVERAYFPSESGEVIKSEQRVSMKPRTAGGLSVTKAHVLALMVEKQYKHWCGLSLWDEVDLEPLLGSAAVWAKGSKAGWDSIYIVAIRRHKTRTSTHGTTCWYPELEMRIKC